MTSLATGILTESRLSQVGFRHIREPAKQSLGHPSTLQQPLLVQLARREVHDQVTYVAPVRYHGTGHGPLKVKALTSHFVALQPEMNPRHPGFEDRTGAGLVKTDSASP